MSSNQETKNSGAAVAEPKSDTPKPRAKEKTKPDKKPRKQPPYNVVLLDDNGHTYGYVIRMLGKLFGYNDVKARNLAQQVDYTGRAIVLTTTKEHAELKRDQIHAFGPDPLIEWCAGSMSALIEPAIA